MLETALGYLLLTMMGLLNTILGGYILCAIWTWFVVRHLHLPAIHVTTAIGFWTMLGIIGIGSNTYLIDLGEELRGKRSTSQLISEQVKMCGGMLLLFLTAAVCHYIEH
jgi:hypothetical protein